MKRFIDVHSGEVMAGLGDIVLKSETSNACLVIAAYESVHKVGALAHTIFSSNHHDLKMDFTMMEEASKAVDAMINDMTLLGADKNAIEVRFITGENIPHEQEDPIYNRNLTLAMEVLKEKQLRLREQPAKDVGRHHIALDVESGEVALTD